jgi:hypothetical protein
MSANSPRADSDDARFDLGGGVGVNIPAENVETFKKFVGKRGMDIEEIRPSSIISDPEGPPTLVDEEDLAPLRAILDAEDAIASTKTAKATGRLGTRRVASSAVGLVTAATRLLPAVDRARYSEEYRSELWDLAQSGVGRLGQLLYATRQFLNMARVSLVLRSPRRHHPAA